MSSYFSRRKRNKSAHRRCVQRTWSWQFSCAPISHSKQPQSQAAFREFSNIAHPLDLWTLLSQTRRASLICGGARGRIHEAHSIRVIGKSLFWVRPSGVLSHASGAELFYIKREYPLPLNRQLGTECQAQNFQPHTFLVRRAEFFRRPLI